MPLDFSLSDRVVDWRDRIAAFVAETVVPREQEAFRHGVDDDLRRELQGAARAAGLWAPTAAAALGGGGFRLDESAVLLEEAGTSLLGPLALNCSAPDEGNIHLLDVVGTPEQRERYLTPLVRGEIRSCFAMTEPVPGAGSDPSSLLTVARPRSGGSRGSGGSSGSGGSGGWTISGEKHLITGADGAAFAIVMARVADTDGAVMLLVDAGTPGFAVKEHARTIDGASVGGHCRVVFDDVEVGPEAVLGEVGLGFRYAQVRLAPARLTHCMRWLGAARRAHEIALDRAVSREVFGARLADHGMAQQLIADNEIDLAAARALVWQVAWQLSQGDKGGEESSRAKVFVSEAVGRVVDRSVQLAGGLGTADELVIGRIYADIRAFRIYDGASEVHRMSIAKRVVRRAVARAESRSSAP